MTYAVRTLQLDHYRSWNNKLIPVLRDEDRVSVVYLNVILHFSFYFFINWPTVHKGCHLTTSNTHVFCNDVSKMIELISRKAFQYFPESISNMTIISKHTTLALCWWFLCPVSNDRTSTKRRKFPTCNLIPKIAIISVEAFLVQTGILLTHFREMTCQIDVILSHIHHNVQFQLHTVFHRHGALSIKDKRDVYLSYV